MGEDNSTTTNVLVELKEKFPLKINMDTQEMRDRYYGGEGQSRDAFEELCALYDAIQHERETNREGARAKMILLREKNAIMVDAYNNLAEDAHDRSDSSSSSDSSDGE